MHPLGLCRMETVNDAFMILPAGIAVGGAVALAALGALAALWRHQLLKVLKSFALDLVLSQLQLDGNRSGNRLTA